MTFLIWSLWSNDCSLQAKKDNLIYGNKVDVLPPSSPYLYWEWLQVPWELEHCYTGHTSIIHTKVWRLQEDMWCCVGFSPLFESFKSKFRFFNVVSDFLLNWPLGQFSLYVTMFICLSVSLCHRSEPRGRTALTRDFWWKNVSLKMPK